MTERPEEKYARLMVQRVLGVPVAAYDDGSADGMPDALVQGSEGIEPMEVFGHWDGDYMALQHGLKKYGRRIALNPDEPAWEVTLVHEVARVRTLLRGLRALLTSHQSELLNGSVPDDLVRMGIEDARPVPGRFGFIHLSAAGWNSWDHPESFGEWLDRCFATSRDVPAKLALYGGAHQHAFLWVGSLSAWSALDQLEIDDNLMEPLPDHEPDVPRSLTDIWIASTLVRPSRGILHWKRGIGWDFHPFNLTSEDWNE